MKDAHGREMLVDDHYQLSGDPLPLPDPGTTLEQLLEQGTVGKYVLEHGLSVVADRMPKPSERSLYTIGDDLLALEWLLVEAEGVLEPGEEEQIIDRWFSELRGERDKKLDDYAGLIRATTVRATARKGEIDRMRGLAAADDRLAGRLKERLLFFLERTGESKIETTHFRIRRQANGGQLALDWRIGEERYRELPEPLREERTVYVPNQKEIRAALDAAVAARRERMGRVRDSVLAIPNPTGAKLVHLISGVLGMTHEEVHERFRSNSDPDALYAALGNVLDCVAVHFPLTEAEGVLRFVDYKERGSHVRID